MELLLYNFSSLWSWKTLQTSLKSLSENQSSCHDDPTNFNLYNFQWKKCFLLKIHALFYRVTVWRNSSPIFNKWFFLFFVFHGKEKLEREIENGKSFLQPIQPIVLLLVYDWLVFIIGAYIICKICASCPQLMHLFLIAFLLSTKCCFG